MLEYEKIDVSEGVVANKPSDLRKTLFFITGNFLK